jgi:hypothetical protein
MAAVREREHGYARYKLDGCRCYTCGWAVAQYNEAREHAIRRGQWQPFVDSEPARQHVINLQACGLGTRRIAELARLERKTVIVLLSGRPDRGTPPPAKIRPATATALLAVQPTLDNLGSAVVINATGTTRRLQALIRAGWPQHHLAVRLGMTDSNFGVCLRRQQVTVRVARAVRVLYGELEYANPREHGVDLRAFSRAQNHAVQNQWAPAVAWDEDTIDSPEAFPEWTGACGTTKGYSIHKASDIPFCKPCRDARAAYKRELRAAQATAA